MKGLWKENLRGYNAKGQKRKSQNRKQTIKDGVTWHIKDFEYKDNRNGVVTSTINTNPGVYGFYIKEKKELYCELWNILTDDYRWQLFENGKSQLAYKYRNGWYCYYTNELIEKSVKKMSFIENIYINKDENLGIRFKRTYDSSGRDTYRLLFAGKMLPNKYYKMFGFYGSAKRKHIQKMVNKIDRAKVREYIAKRDWNKDVKTHSLSKSIAWEIW